MNTKLLIFTIIATLIPAQALCAADSIIIYEASAARDPFVSALPKKIEIKIEPASVPITKPKLRAKPKVIVIPPPLKIQGVIWNSNKPQAIINGEVIGVNGQVAKSVVQLIDQHGVTVLYQNQHFLYPVDGSKVKKIDRDVPVIEQTQNDDVDLKESLEISPKALMPLKAPVILEHAKAKPLKKLKSVLPGDRMREMIEQLEDH
ncbi:MAG: hypothetical protein ACI9CF_000393 [Candidatus Omnitrophota bacterium]|jgi:hypothetical protein